MHYRASRHVIYVVWMSTFRLYIYIGRW